MAIREELTLDLTRALAQVDDLERQLDGLLQPIEIPVEIDGEGALTELRNDIRAADTEEVDIQVRSDDLLQAEDALEEVRRELGLVDDELEEVEQQSQRTGREMTDAGRKGSSAFGNLRGAVLGIASAFAIFRGARGLIDFFGDSISSASDLEESLSKTRVVFGDFAKDIETFASTAPSALGLSNAAALEFAGTFGNLFVALGLTQSAAADLAPDIVQLGADLASFNNIDVTDSLDKLRAGLVGEAEPLRALGVNITAATTAAKAMELGLADANGEVSEAAKVQARYALILEQTATAQGDFERTADGIANRQRTLAAEFENVRASIGEALLPVFEELLTIAPQLIQIIEDLGPAVADMAESFADVLEDSGPFIEFLGDVARVAPTVIGGIGDIAGVLGNVASAAFDLSRLNLVGFFQQLADIPGNLGDKLALEQLQTGLVDRLRAGEDAAEALEQQLLGLRDIDIDSEALGDAAADFVRIADVGDGEIARLSILFGELGEEAGFSAEEVDAVRKSFQELFADPAVRGGGLDFTRGRGAGDLSEDILTDAQALDILADAADAAGISLAELLTNADAIPPEFQALAAGVDDSTIAFLQSVDRLDEVKAEIGTLPGAMEAAREALRDEEGEIVDDFNTFFDNLLEELQAREAFESNLAILRSLGLDNLAAVFDEAGQEAAAALADAVANPADAARADAEISGRAEGLANTYIQTFKDAIAGLPVTQDLIDNIVTAAAGADTPEVRAALEFLASQLQTQILLTPTLDESGFANVQNLLSQRIPELGATVPGGGVTVINNFETAPNPTTDTQRITQTVSSVSGLVR